MVDTRYRESISEALDDLERSMDKYRQAALSQTSRQSDHKWSRPGEVSSDSLRDYCPCGKWPRPEEVLPDNLRDYYPSGKWPRPDEVLPDNLRDYCPSGKWPRSDKVLPHAT
ncbi:hypothetical protein IFM51744_09093 [Aspergillus udagawae]|nr:hypothetical protein IFM51744_09093 [Aspergillus udagawae]